MDKKTIGLITLGIIVLILGSFIFFYSGNVSKINIDENKKVTPDNYKQLCEDCGISNETGYINDENAYISATPHTLTKSGYVEFEINSKTYSGDINVIWGFNTSITKPQNAELYNPTNETWNTSHQKDIYNITLNSATNLSCDYGNSYNNIHQEVTYLGINETNETTNVFCFDSFTQNGDDYRIYWNTKHSKMKYWHDISGELGKVNYNLDGKDTWYYAQNVPIQVNQTYKIRSYINVNPNSQGKYDFAVYPSSYGLTTSGLSNAYLDGNLYLLDPWWNSSYEEKYKHNDNGSGYTGIGYFGNNVTGWYGTIGNNAYTYNSTDTTNDYIVANDTNELCWFDTQNDRSNCPSQTGSASSLISYYALDRESGDVKDYIGNNDGTNNGATRGVTGKINNAFDFVQSEGDNITTPNFFGSGDSLTVSSWVYIDSFTGNINSILFTKEEIQFRVNDDGSISHSIHDGSSWNELSTSAGVINSGQWYHITFVHDSSYNEIYVDGSLNASNSLSYSLNSNTDTNYIGINPKYPQHAMNGKIDDVRIYDTALTSTEVSNLYSSTNNQRPYLEGVETENADSPPSVILNSPEENEVFKAKDNPITFNCSVSDDINLVNVSLYVDGILKETNTSGINDTYYIWDKTIDEGLHNWTCEAYDNANQSTKPTARDFSMLNLTINSPTNGSIIHGSYVLLNATAYGKQNINLSFYDYNNESLCYQESANVSNQSGTDGSCDLNYSGSYSENSNEKSIDGNWTTTDGIDNFEINYSKPSYSSSAIWSVKDGVNNKNIVNLTIPSSCFNYYDKKITLKINHSVDDFFNSIFTYKCYNGNFVNIDSFAGNGAKAFYEEAIYYIENASTLLNKTIGVTNGEDVTYNWTSLVGNTTYKWYAEVKKDGTQSISDLYQFDTDAIAPLINITSPKDEIDYGYINKTETLNYTVNDTNLDTCWYNYNGTNITLSNCVNTTFNIFYLGFNSNNLTVYANDTLGNTNSKFIDWKYKVFETERGFVDTVVEGDSQDFAINVSYDSDKYYLGGSLIYNGTKYDGTVDRNDKNKTRIQETISIPGVETNTDLDFYWLIGLSTGEGTEEILTSNSTQTVESMDISKTGNPYTSPFINFTIYDEQTLKELNATIDLTFDYKVEGGSVEQTFSYSDQTENDSEWSFAFNPSDEIYEISATIDIEATGYSHKFYNFKGIKIDNDTTQYNMYLLPDTDSTSFIVTVRDSTYTPLKGVEVYTQRYYPSNNTWKTAEITETNSKGETVKHFFTENTKYRFKIYREGELLYTSPSTLIYCESSPCEVEVIVPEVFKPIVPEYEDLDNLDSSLEYDEGNQNVVFSYSDTSGNFTEGKLKVKRKNFGDPSININCNKIKNSSTAVITCDLTGAENGTYIASGFITRNKEYLTNRISFNKEISIAEEVGEDGVLWAIFILIGIVMLGLYRPSIGIGFGIIGTVLISFLNIISIPITALVSIAGIGIILFMEVRKE